MRDLGHETGRNIFIAKNEFTDAFFPLTFIIVPILNSVD